MESKILYTIGNCMTMGVELDNPEVESYPYLLSQKLGCELINQAEPASSNDWIFRKSVEWIATNDTSKVHTFIVGWSSPDRREENFKFFYGGPSQIECGFRKRDDHYDIIKEKIGKLSRVVKEHIHLGKEDSTSKVISELLYNRELSLIKTLTYVYSLQELLKSKNINYVFFFPGWYNILMKEKGISDIYLHIDKKYCIEQTIDDTKKGNWVSWYSEDSEILSGRHPNKKEHQWMSDKLYHFIGDKYGF